MHHLQMVNNCPLILALLPTPGAVGQAIEVAKGTCVMYAHQSHNFGDSDGGTGTEELEAFW